MSALTKNIKLMVVTAHFFDRDGVHAEQKLPNLDAMINSVSSIETAKTHIIVIANNYFDRLDVQVVVEEEKPGHWLMPWAHKRYLNEFLESDFTHFMYLEDDMEFTQTNMDYWLETQDLFERNGLRFIPGLHRIEKDESGVPYSLDANARLKVKERPCVTVEEQEFVSLIQPYQGMYIMDKAMAQEHINSIYYHRGEHHPYTPADIEAADDMGHHLTRLLHYGFPESAALGNVLLDPPEGFTHRHLHPLKDFDRTWVYHNTNKYVASAKGVDPGHHAWKPQATEFLDFS